MENEQITEMLADMISAFMTPGLSRAAVKKAASKLQTSVIEADIELPYGFDRAKAALETCGTVIADAVGETADTEGMVCGVICSGFGGLNPCYVIISASDRRLNVKAYAKEGLIKQHTAEKAIDIYKTTLFN